MAGSRIEVLDLMEVDRRLRIIQNERNLQEQHPQQDPDIEQEPWLWEPRQILTVSLLFTVSGIVLGTSFFRGFASNPPVPAQLEPWRRTVCEIHEQLRSLSHSEAFEPIHKLLRLPTHGEPFFPLSESSTPAGHSYQAVQETILKRLSELCQAQAPSVLQDLLRGPAVDFVRGQSDQWMQLMHRAAHALLNDETRNAYARFFIPVLQGPIAQREMAIARLCRRR